MLALFAILFYGVPMLVVACTLLAIFFKLQLMIMTALRSIVLGALSILLCCLCAAMSHIVLAPALTKMLPSAHRIGDGGRGIGIDLVATAAIHTILPMIAAVVFSAMIIAALRFIDSARIE